MTAWVMVVHLASFSHGLVAIPGIASQEECEKLNAAIITNFPTHTYPQKAPGSRFPTSDTNAKCLSYEIAR
jgi:hypothetical protein